MAVSIKAKYDIVVDRLKTANALIRVLQAQVTQLQGQNLGLTLASIQKLKDLNITDVDVDAIVYMTQVDPLA